MRVSPPALPGQSGESSPAIEPVRATARKIRTLIVDDQELARELLRRMLRNESDIEIVGTPGNGREAVQAIQALRPDLVFLDVQMPELDGFGVMAEIEPANRPAVIFVTANHQFALKAFDVHALDYLLKPCTRDRFQLALQRARDEIHRKNSQEIGRQLAELLGRDFRSQSPVAHRVPIKSSGRILFLDLSDIAWIEAADNYAKVHVGDEFHLLRETMTALESRLPADRFLRISRSAIVNVEHIRELQPLFHGEYRVVLRNGAHLTLTRGYRDKLRQLGLS